MDRKGFLKALGLTAVASIFAPKLMAEVKPESVPDLQIPPSSGLESLADLPEAEIQALRMHLLEALADPDYTVVVNYEMSEVFKVAEFYGIELEESGILVVSAPCIPASEVMALRNQVDGVLYKPYATASKDDLQFIQAHHMSAKEMVRLREIILTHVDHPERFVIVNYHVDKWYFPNFDRG